MPKDTRNTDSSSNEAPKPNLNELPLSRHRLAFERLESRAMFDASGFGFDRFDWDDIEAPAPAHSFVNNSVSLSEIRFADDGFQRQRQHHEFAVNRVSTQVVYYLVLTPQPNRNSVAIVRPVSLPQNQVNLSSTLPQPSSSLSHSASVSRSAETSIAQTNTLSARINSDRNNPESSLALSIFTNAPRTTNASAGLANISSRVLPNEKDQSPQAFDFQIKDKQFNDKPNAIGLKGMLSISLSEAEPTGSSTNELGRHSLGLELDLQQSLVDDIALQWTSDTVWPSAGPTKRSLDIDSAIDNHLWIEQQPNCEAITHDSSHLPDGMLPINLIPAEAIVRSPMVASVDPLAIVQLFMGGESESGAILTSSENVSLEESAEKHPNVVERFLRDPRAASISSFALGVIAVLTARQRQRRSAHSDFEASLLPRPPKQ